MSAEDRVIAALHTLADGTSAPPDAQHRLVSRLRREHRRRRTATLVGSVAAVAGIAVVAGTLGSGAGSAAPTPAPLASAGAPSDLAPTEKASPEPSPSPSPPPTYPPPAAGVGGPSQVMTVEAGGKWGLRDARTGALLTSGALTGYRVTAVAAARDGRTFYVAATKGTCGDWRVQRLRASRTARGDSVIASDLPGAAGPTGEISSMAVSADTRRLAYALADGVDPDYGDCMAFRLRVVDVRTGARRTWTGDGGAMLSALNWGPDDRTLLMHLQACCGDYNPGVSRLDSSSGSTFEGGPETPGTADFGNCVVSVTASSDTEVYAAQECFDAAAVHVVVLDPASGRVVRRIATIEGVDRAGSLTVTADGRHVLLSASGDADSGNYRVDDGRVSQLPTHLDALVW